MNTIEKKSNTEKFSYTKEQLENWKKEYEDIFLIETDGYSCILKKADRNAISKASAVGGNDAMLFNAIILESCWIAGDECIKTDDSLFLGVSAKINELIVIKQAEIKKL